MKKRILYIAKNIPTPQENNNPVILNIAQALDQEFDIDILFPKEFVPWGMHFLPKYNALYHTTPWKFNGSWIKILEYIRLPFKSFAFKYALSNQIFSEEAYGKYDLIHAHFIFPDGLITQALSTKLSKKYVVTVRQSDISLLKEVSRSSSTWTMAKKVLESATAIHVLNQSGEWYLKEHFEVTSVLIPHGIDESKILRKEELGSPNNDNVNICVVGNATETKQIDWVIKTVLSSKALSEKVQLTIIGDGPKLQELKNLSCGADHIRFLGKIPHKEVFDHLKESDIFALPSRKESFGLVYLEAAATFNAIIGFRGTGIDGVLEEEKEIIYVENFKDFGNALLNLIEDKELRNKMSTNAWERVHDYKWSEIHGRYIKLYRRLI